MMRLHCRWPLLLLLIYVPVASLFGQDDQDVQQTPLAGNEEVARIMREFSGRGDLGDGSPPLTPAESLATMQVPNDLQIELIASEPDVAQPLQVSFDRRGRMWVVQYRQYPFPLA